MVCGRGHSRIVPKWPSIPRGKIAFISLNFVSAFKENHIAGDKAF